MSHAHGPLAAALAPSRALAARAALAVGFSLLTALAAQIAIPLPFTPVPVTGQTFAVLLTGALLGSRTGAAAMAAYLLEGIAGLPVFAGGTSGIGKIVGPTGGYLLSFPAAAFAVGFLAERGWDRRLRTAIPAMLVGNAIIYAVGLPWLGLHAAVLPPGTTVLAAGLLPFIPGDLYKLFLAAALLPTGRSLLRRFGGAGRAPV